MQLLRCNLYYDGANDALKDEKRVKNGNRT